MGISSAPYLIDPVQFGLNKVETNKKRLRDLKEFPSKKVGVYKGKDLIEYTKSSTESFIIMEHDEQIIYLVHLIVAKLNQFEQTSVTQVEVWRDDSYSNYVRGLARHVFRKILLTRHKYVVSDQAQSSLGKRFWVQMMSDLSSQGYRVGVFDEDDNETSWAPKDQRGFVAWVREREHDSWGIDQNKHYYIRFVIKAK